MGLLAVEVDDVMLFNIQVDFFAVGQLDNAGFHLVCIDIQPLGNGAGGIGIDHTLDLIRSSALFGNGNNIASLQQDRGDVGLVAVKGIVTVSYELTGFFLEEARPAR